ncbi:MAG: 3,4-dihydroxy-2-butanone-4-phosphate synthase [Betaproteobacteria bacterium]|nr:3,4-dihydroxy-2-butanone-4-phosphate synthase [Betaproteobacteria bacterium]
MALSSITDIIADMRAGKMVILVDEEDRENEGDLVLAAEFVTPEAVNFMARFGRGLICLTLTEERCRQLDLSLMVTRNGTRHGTKFTVSIEAAEGVSTGISAADRARTIQAAIARDARPDHLVQPGHVFPLRAEKGGVLVRAGHTEAGCDLAALAGLQPASVICEIMNDDGTMARLPDLIEFGRTHGLKIGTIADLIGYRSANESLVERMGESTVQTVHGEFRMLTYRDRAAGGAHLALVCGAPGPGNDALVRVQELASIIDLIDTKRGSHSWSVHKALAAIAASGCGALVLLNCSNAGAPLVSAIVGSGVSAAATGAVPQRPKMDLRSYGIGAQILRDIGVGRMKLLSRPVKLPSMGGFSLQVTGFAHEAEPDIAVPISQGEFNVG